MRLRQVVVRLPQRLGTRLQELADLEELPVAELIRRFLEDAIESAVDLTPTSELEVRAVELARSRLRWDPEALRRRINSLEAQRREIEERLNALGERDTSYRLALVDDLRRVEDELEEARADMRRWGDALAAARAEVAREAVKPVCEFLNGIVDDLAEAMDWLRDVSRWVGNPTLYEAAWEVLKKKLRREEP